MKRHHPSTLSRGTTLLLLMGLMALVVGCVTRPPPAPPSYAVLLDNPDGTTGAIMVNGAKGQILVNKTRFGATLDGSGVSCIFDQTQFEDDFKDVLAARPQLPVTFVLNFTDGGTTLSAESQALIEKVLAAVKGRPVPDVSIIGHTDTMGSAEDNEKLGLQRAQLVAKLLTAAGLKVADLTVDSHGEFNLLVKTPDDTSEPRNHRVEITIR